MKITLELEKEEVLKIIDHFKNHTEFDHCWDEFDKPLATKLINMFKNI